MKSLIPPILAAGDFSDGVARGYLRASEEGVLISLHVSPGARSTELKGLYGEKAIKLSVAAPPEKGRANAEVERFPSGALGVAASRVEVLRGVSGRDKIVLARCASEEHAGRALDDLLGV